MTRDLYHVTDGAAVLLVAAESPAEAIDVARGYGHGVVDVEAHLTSRRVDAPTVRAGGQDLTPVELAALADGKTGARQIVASTRPDHRRK